MKIVINITGWRRPDYIEQTITALKNCYLFDQFTYRVSVDAGYPDKQQQIKDVLIKHQFKCEYTQHVTRQGCAGNVGHAFLTSFDQHDADAVIMLEDDTIPSRDFLVYMKDMLERYEHDDTVWNISGYNRRVHKIKNINSAHKTMQGPGEPDKIFTRDWFTSWGWAMWRRNRQEIRDNWFGIHWNNKDGKNGDSCPKGERFLEYIIKDSTGSWAWPMNMYWRRDRKEIAPDLSRIQNIGAEAGMFSPGDQWHRDNHYCEIWMDDIENKSCDSYIWNT